MYLGQVALFGFVTIWLLDDDDNIIEPSVNRQMIDTQHARVYNR